MSYFSLFQSTHPARGATIAAISSGLSTSFQSTHPARGATVRRPPFCFHFDISIHAPREGCDSLPSAPATTSTYFNPRTPRGVRRQRVCTISMGNRNFNPRTPRGVRLFGVLTKNRSLDFNPRTPRGVRRGGMSAPMRGGDFNPRTPRGVRRSVMRSSICSNSISIHAPREGCDERPCCTSETGRHYFNPRTPRGVRHLLAEGQSAILEFQSTHPARGATSPVRGS